MHSEINVQIPVLWSGIVVLLFYCFDSFWATPSNTGGFFWIRIFRITSGWLREKYRVQGIESKLTICNVSLQIDVLLLWSPIFIYTFILWPFSFILFIYTFILCPDLPLSVPTLFENLGLFFFSILFSLNKTKEFILLLFHTTKTQFLLDNIWVMARWQVEQTIMYPIKET